MNVFISISSQKMTSNSRSSSKNEDDESNGSKKNPVNGTVSGTSDMPTLRRSTRETSKPLMYINSPSTQKSNQQMSKSAPSTRRSTGESSDQKVSTSSPSTRKSERLVKMTSVSAPPLINRKSERIHKKLTPSPLRRSDRDKKQMSSSSSGSKKSEKTSVAIDLALLEVKKEKSLNELTHKVRKSEDRKSAQVKRRKLDGHTFKALFKTEQTKTVAAERNGIQSPKRDGTIEETFANADKLLVDCPREEWLETPDSIRKSVDAGIGIECGDRTTLSKRKKDLLMDLDASSVDVHARTDICTCTSDDLCSSAGCKTHHVFETRVPCSKRVDDDAQGKDFCSYSTLVAKVSPETINIEKPETEAVEVGNKRKKVGGFCNSPSKLNPGLEQDKSAEGASTSPGDNGLRVKSDAGATNTVHNTNAPMFGKNTMPDAQKNLHHLLKPDILKLCETLKLSDEVKIMADRFLEYVIANHQVQCEKKNILQALLISLCWSAAALLKQRVGRKESLSLAKHHLNFICDEKEAEYVYSALRKLKKPFLRENLCELDFSKDNKGAVIKGKVDERTLQSTTFNSQTKIRDQVFNDEMAKDDEMDKGDTEKKLKLIQTKCNKHKLKPDLEEEIKKLNRYWEERQLTLENKHRVESAFYREVYFNKPIRVDKLKALDSDYRKKLKELKLQKEVSLEQLKLQHLDALSDTSRRVTEGLNSATSSATEVADQDKLPLHGSDIQNPVGYSQAAEHGCPDVSENDTLTIKVDQNSKNDEMENLGLVNVYVARSQQPNGLGGSISVHGNTGSASQYNSENHNPDGRLLRAPDETILPEILERITKKVTGDASSLELGTAAVELDEGNDRLRDVAHDTPNSTETHSNGEASTSVGVDSPSTQMLQLASSPTCNQVVVPALQPINAKEVKHHNHDAPVVEISTNIEQMQMELSTDSPLGRSPSDLPLASGCTPQTLDERPTPSQCAEVQLSEDAMDLSGQVFSLTGQTVEQIPPVDDRERPLADKQPGNRLNISKIQQEIVERTTLLRNQVLPHHGANVELHPPTNVLETPLRQNQLDLSSSRHQPLNLSASFLNPAAVQEVTENATELATQAVVHTRVDMPVVQRHNDLSLHDENQDPSQMPTLTSYGDPLQNEMEGICKEIEQANKVQEVVDITLKSELDELIAQLHRTYEAKRQDAQASFLQKKRELNDNYNKVLMNKMLADAFRSKCVEASRRTGMQQQVVNPLHIEPRPSPNATTSSAGQPATSQQITTPMLLPSSRLHPANTSSTAHHPVASQQNTAPTLQPALRLHPPGISSLARQQSTAPMLQPASRLHPISASSMARQPAVSQQNTTPTLQPASRLHPVTQRATGNQHSTAPMLQPALRLHPVNASSTARQPTASQQNTASLVQPASRLHPINASSAAHQPAASQQNTAPVLQPASRLHPVSASSKAHQAVTSQQNIAVSLHHGKRVPVSGSSSGSQPAAKLRMQPEPGDNLVPVLNSADLAAASQQNTARQLRPAAGTFPISVSSASPPVVSQQSTQPPLQIVHQSGAVFSSTSTRPPQINPITPLTGNLRVGSENCARAPAPHLQAFRSTDSINLTSTQRTLPSHLTTSCLPTSSSNPIPHAPSSSGVSLIPTNYCSPNYSRPLQSSGTTDMLPPGVSTPISAPVSRQELLNDIHKQHTAHRVDVDSPLPLGLKLDSKDLSITESGPSLPPVSRQELPIDIGEQHAAQRLDAGSPLPLGLKLDSKDLSITETGPSLPPVSRQELPIDIGEQHAAQRLDADSPLPLGLKLDSKDLSITETGPSLPPVSRQELPIDIGEQHAAQRLDADSPLPLGLKLDLISLPVLETGTSMPPDSTTANMTTDDVCLSHEA